MNVHCHTSERVSFQYTKKCLTLWPENQLALLVAQGSIATGTVRTAANANELKV